MQLRDVAPRGSSACAEDGVPTTSAPEHAVCRQVEDQPSAAGHLGGYLVWLKSTGVLQQLVRCVQETKSSVAEAVPVSGRSGRTFLRA
jgi:hypothetical protein